MKFAKALKRLRRAIEKLAVSSLGCVHNGARNKSRDIKEGLEEVVMTMELPGTFAKADHKQFYEEIPSGISMSEADVEVEERKSDISGAEPAINFHNMDCHDLVTRGEEEKQNMVSLNIETNMIDDTDYIQGGTTKVEEGLYKVEAEQLVEDHILEVEKMLDTSSGRVCG